MVNRIYRYLLSENLLADLSSISDGICQNNGQSYLDFDQFVAKAHANKWVEGSQLASCDSLLFNLSEAHIIFVEFKDMNSLNDDAGVQQWWKGKNRSVYLKITDSILLLGHYLKELKKESYDDFMDVKKSFFLVYKSDDYKSKIKNHLRHQFNRYNFLFENTSVIETQNFEKFLNSNSLK